MPSGGYYGGTEKVPAWEIESVSPWNWGLMYYPNGLAGVATVEKRDGMPVVRIPAYRVDNWCLDPATQRQRDMRKEYDHVVTRPAEMIELVPSGTTRMRVGLFQEVVPTAGL